MAETFGDRLQTRTLRLSIKRIVGIGAVHNLREENQLRLIPKIVLFEDCLERTLFPMMAELDALHVKRNCSEPLGLVHHLRCRHKEELSVRIYKFLDQPGTGHPIHVHSFACNPLHDFNSFDCGTTTIAVASMLLFSCLERLLQCLHNESDSPRC